MQIRQLKISNFRGIATLDWTPANAFCCLIGAGDSGKSTILDAVEAALSSRWLTFTEPDFLGCQPSHPIVIEVTVGELSKALKSDERFGLYVRGWIDTGEIRDEPEDGDEAVLTIRLTVDASMEPVWELVCDRIEDPRTLSNRDRALFGLVRLAGEDARHLTWGQGSVLSRLSGDNDEASARLAEAYRAARDSAQLDKILALATTAKTAEGLAKGLGAYVEGTYKPGLELGRGGLSSGSIALHDDNVPLRLAGLGTRRLATLAIQKSAIAEGAIVLVDEIEHGLEPHRVIGAISQLKSDQEKAKNEKKPVGNVLISTHSDVALAEVGVESLGFVQTSRPARITTITTSKTPSVINPIVRFTPRALFARRILVAEGNTEVGLLLGLRETWPSRHASKPIEQLGAAIADGNGGQTTVLAASLASLGYKTAIYRDSDSPLSAAQLRELRGAGIQVIEYNTPINTEQAIFSAASDASVQELLGYARAEKGDDAINNHIIAKINDLTIEDIKGNFSIWQLISARDATQLRDDLAGIASNKKWFKDQRIARGLAPIIQNIITKTPKAPIAQALLQAETWLYA